MAYYSKDKSLINESLPDGRQVGEGFFMYSPREFYQTLLVTG